VKKADEVIGADADSEAVFGAGGVSHRDLAHVLAFARVDAERLRGRRLFITGGTGFFGAWLLQSLLYLNRELALELNLTVLTRDPVAARGRAPWLAPALGVTLVKGDVRQLEEVSGRYDDVIHCATPASLELNETRPEEMLSIVVDGMRSVLSFVERAGCERILFTSSGAVYGAMGEGSSCFSEDDTSAPLPFDLRSSYHQGKRFSEHLLALAAARTGLEAKVARCFAFSGPHLPLDLHFAFGNFIRDANAGREICLTGDGSAVRSYLYGADLVVWLLGILVRGASSRPYNVGSNVPVSVRVLAERIGNQAGVGVRVGMPSGAGVNRYVPSVARAAAELGLFERVSLDDQILRSLAWAKRWYPSAP
jgi:nucleoside-diphosphate-sugar epimerase